MIWRANVERALAAFCVLVMVSGCSTTGSLASQHNRPPAAIPAPFDGAAVLPPADMTDDGPGSLIAVEPLEDNPDFDRVNVTAVRVVYRSTNAKGSPTTVSGIVAVFTVSDNHPTANSVQLSRKLLRQQRSRLHTGLLRVRHCSAVGDAGSMVTNSARPLMVRTDIRTG